MRAGACRLQGRKGGQAPGHLQAEAAVVAIEVGILDQILDGLHHLRAAGRAAASAAFKLEAGRAPMAPSAAGARLRRSRRRCQVPWQRRAGRWLPFPGLAFFSRLPCSIRASNMAATAAAGCGEHGGRSRETATGVLQGLAAL